jgi:Flp pilus assembly protein TadG
MSRILVEILGSLRRPWRRFRRDQTGATAVEFGLVAAPFLALMFAIIETAMVFFAGQTLEMATADASRLILTGQAQNNPDLKDKTPEEKHAAFKQEVCNRIKALLDCGSADFMVDVRPASFFATGDLSKPTVNGKIDPDFKAGYQPGSGGEIVIVRVMYQWPIYVSLNLANMNGSKRLLMATAAFKNEPF